MTAAPVFNDLLRRYPTRSSSTRNAAYVFAVCGVGWILVVEALSSLFEAFNRLFAPPRLQHTRLVVFTTCYSDENRYNSPHDITVYGAFSTTNEVCSVTKRLKLLINCCRENGSERVNLGRQIRESIRGPWRHQHRRSWCIYQYTVPYQLSHKIN